MSKKVLLATKGTPSCSNAEKSAISYCRANDAELVVLHIVDSSLKHFGQIDPLATEIDKSYFVEYIDRLCEYEAKERLESLKSLADLSAIPHQLRICDGSPLQTIVQTVSEVKPELLIIGGKARPAYRFFSLSNRIHRKVRCPVQQVHYA